MVDGLVWLVGMLHGDGMREFIEHALLESFQTLIVMTTAYKLLILKSTHKQTPKHTHTSKYIHKQPNQTYIVGKSATKWT